jgi:hypothetical protein
MAFACILVGKGEQQFELRIKKMNHVGFGMVSRTGASMCNPGKKKKIRAKKEEETINVLCFKGCTTPKPFFPNGRRKRIRQE